MKKIMGIAVVGIFAIFGYMFGKMLGGGSE
jgi:hypothetical protein